MNESQDISHSTCSPAPPAPGVIAELAQQTGLRDSETLHRLAALGFTGETLCLLPLLPVVQVAWAAEGMSLPEQRYICHLASSKRIPPDSRAFEKLLTWLAVPPTTEFFREVMAILPVLFKVHPDSLRRLKIHELIRNCTHVAALTKEASARPRIYQTEQQVLEQIATTLLGSLVQPVSKAESMIAPL
ncbi:MAG: hypothetical protein K1Y36_13725 [Blastocatellia bacterium]|nr:hypothetical protein [Blastocatellia bacterium]